MSTTYHPDPKINAEIIADATDAERADLAAGYAPRRWRCICGAEHSRGHAGAVLVKPPARSFRARRRARPGFGHAAPARLPLTTACEALT